MCDPVSAAIATGIGAAASVAGSAMSASAQSSAARATASQNAADIQAQNAAFMERNQAARQQTAAQFAASQQTLSDQAAALQQMREQQSSALTNYQNTLQAENTQETALRGVGDTAAQQLLTQTSGPNLAAAQQAREAEAATLLQPGLATATQGPGPTDPSGGTNPPGNAVTTDPVMQAALARRTAEAATNIRTYGSEIGKLSAYDAPTQTVNLAIQGNKTGIMPAAEADQLLRSGSATMLLPSQVAYQNATGLGQAASTMIQSRGQSALDAAGLAAGNATDIANLGQSDSETIAANQAAQAKANAAYQASVGSAVSGLGNLAAYAGGRYGGLEALGITGGTNAASPSLATGLSNLFNNAGWYNTVPPSQQTGGIT